jgi:ubiquinol-cytochrome c reductase cytochrome c1 subunit
LFAFALSALVAPTMASESAAKLDHVKIDLSDKPSLQRGAKLFVNYCLSCHGASYMRYNRVAQDLGIPENLTKDMMFTTDKVGELMKSSMPKEDAKAWFGVAPPDLTTVARARSPEWIYTYLRSFYRDEKTVTGWNNTVYPNVAMPHVLYELQGAQRPVTKKNEHGVEQASFEIVTPGSRNAKEFNGDMRDLTNFLVYLGEPGKLARQAVGGWVIFFLLVFAGLAYLLKKEYWKDVH